MNAVARLFRWLAAAVVLSLAASMAAAQTPVLQIAAAADLALCIGELNAAFLKSNGPVDIKVSTGSSGNFYAQIRNGAPFDLFLSADMLYPQALARDGHADLASLQVYGHGQLVMWSSDPAIDVRAGFALLGDPRVKRIAIANPDVAPYGRAAKAALQQAGVWEAIKPKLIMGENVAQTAQFVETGNAQVGFIGAAHIRSESVERVWRLPANLYPLIEQGGIVTAHGRANPLAARYLGFLRMNTGRSILQKYGFLLPA